MGRITVYCEETEIQLVGLRARMIPKPGTLFPLHRGILKPLGSFSTLREGELDDVGQVEPWKKKLV